MEKIWAPWRKKYILAKKKRKCFLCKAAKSKDDKKNYIILRTKFAFSMLNIFPYNNGHILVSTLKHVRNLQSLKEKEVLGLFEVLIKSKLLLDKVLKPQGYNIGINLGKFSGAGIEGHLHLHLVPRWLGDTNFMPVVAETKVISQSLDELYRSLENVKKRRD